MSELDWPTKLLHLRFSRAVLFLEKWMTVLLLCILVFAGLKWPFLATLGLMLLGLFVLAYNGHFNLEEAAGMPVNRVTMRY